MVGKVSMNYKHYTGNDLYSDGSIEDEILDIVVNNPRSDLPRIVEERASWPVFYHLSEQRGNIVEWIPMEQGAKVLEVGSGCGAVTSALSAKNIRLDCVELSKRRSLINANRNRDRDGITIHVGNFRDIEPDLDRDYQYIFLIGVLEYAQNYIGGDRPFETFIYLMMKHLAPEGRLVIAIENRLGMKYFAGCKEDHAGSYFTGIEGYKLDDPARTFSRDGLIKIMRNAGVSEYHFYYPYPDYKFTSMIHSDQHLPKRGEFIDNVRNYDNDRMVLFNEKYALEALAEDRMYQEFSNSFEVVIGPALPTIYVKYSNDRADEFKIRTDIVLDQLGRRQIHKYPLSVAAREHVYGMANAYLALKDRYNGGDLQINDCQIDGRYDAAIFSFVNGVTLASLMDDCISKGDMAGFNSLFQEYLKRISYREDYPIADYDLIFSNILVNGPVWTVIDYEWTYGKRISTRDIAFRALYSYVLEDARRKIIDVDRYYTALGVDKHQYSQLLREEEGFQKYVTGGRKSMVEMWKLLGFRSITPNNLAKEDKKSDRIQVYISSGGGYTEEASYFVNKEYSYEGEVSFDITFSPEMTSVRVDPAFAPCIVTLKGIFWNGRPLKDENIISIQPNGAWISDESIVFNTADPYIEFIPDPSLSDTLNDRTLTLVINCSIISETIAGDLYDYQLSQPEEAVEIEVPIAEAPVQEEDEDEEVELFDFGKDKIGRKRNSSEDYDNPEEKTSFFEVDTYEDEEDEEDDGYDYDDDEEPDAFDRFYENDDYEERKFFRPMKKGSSSSDRKNRK